MSSNNIINKLKELDGYPKTLDDYRIRTLGGGAGKYFIVQQVEVKFICL